MNARLIFLSLCSIASAAGCVPNVAPDASAVDADKPESDPGRNGDSEALDAVALAPIDSGARDVADVPTVDRPVTCLNNRGEVVGDDETWSVLCNTCRCTQSGVICTDFMCTEAGTISDAAPSDAMSGGLYTHCIAPDGTPRRPFLNFMSAEGSGCICYPPLNLACATRALDRRCRMPSGATAAAGERWTSSDGCIRCDCIEARDTPGQMSIQCETIPRCNAFAGPGCFWVDGSFYPSSTPYTSDPCEYCTCARDPQPVRCQRTYGPSCPAP